MHFSKHLTFFAVCLLTAACGDGPGPQATGPADSPHPGVGC